MQGQSKHMGSPSASLQTMRKSPQSVSTTRSKVSAQINRFRATPAVPNGFSEDIFILRAGEM
jgi:hypothetical protein